MHGDAWDLPCLTSDLLSLRWPGSEEENMARAKLTRDHVARLRPRAKRYWSWDVQVPGLGVRVYPSGRKTFALQARIRGTVRILTLGTFPERSVDEARREASKLKLAIRDGRDPRAERNTRRAAPTVAELVQRYLLAADSAKSPRTKAEDRRYAEKFLLPKLGARTVESVSRADLVRLRDGLRSTPTQANRALAFVSSLFSAAERWEMRVPGTNPARGIEKFPEQSRDRTLTDAELARIGRALRELEAENDPQNGASRLAGVRAIQLLLLTGSRRSEILKARWEWIDWETRELVLPRLATKARREHRKPLSPETLSVLERIGIRDEGWIFPSPRDPSKPQGEMRKVWATVCKRAGLEGVRLHDLRRSLASVAAESGVPVPHLMQLMGWTQLRTAEVYVRRRREQTHEHMERIGAVLGEKLAAEPEPNVIPFQRR